jgi:acylphosphatase
MYRAALKNGNFNQISTTQIELNLFEQVLHTQGTGFVDNQAQSTSVAVLAHVNHAAIERFVHQTRHGDQKMMRKVDRLEILGHLVILKGEDEARLSGLF